MSRLRRLGTRTSNLRSSLISATRRACIAHHRFAWSACSTFGSPSPMCHRSSASAQVRSTSVPSQRRGARFRTHTAIFTTTRRVGPAALLDPSGTPGRCADSETRRERIASSPAGSSPAAIRLTMSVCRRNPWPPRRRSETRSPPRRIDTESDPPSCSSADQAALCTGYGVGHRYVGGADARAHTTSYRFARHFRSTACAMLTAAAESSPATALATGYPYTGFIAGSFASAALRTWSLATSARTQALLASVDAAHAAFSFARRPGQSSGAAGPATGIVTARMTHSPCQQRSHHTWSPHRFQPRGSFAQPSTAGFASRCAAHRSHVQRHGCFAALAAAGCGVVSIARGTGDSPFS